MARSWSHWVGAVVALAAGCGGESRSTELGEPSDAGMIPPLTCPHQGYRDADGDGWTVGPAECFESVPEGYLRIRSVWSDCDDSDPAVNRKAFADADGDGYGAAMSGTLCAFGRESGGAPPDGFGWASEDCDDGDAEIYPRAIEEWRDGVDSDCNGLDDPLRCGPDTPSECGCELLKIEDVEIDETCDGVDLFVAALLACTGSVSSRIVVGNRGSAPATSGFTLEFEIPPSSGGDYATSREFSEGLPPGAVTLPILLTGATTVRIVIDDPECDVDNNRAAITPDGGAPSP